MDNVTSHMRYLPSLPRTDQLRYNGLLHFVPSASSNGLDLDIDVGGQLSGLDAGSRWLGRRQELYTEIK